MLLHIKKFSEKLLLPLAKTMKKLPANYFTFLGLIFAIIAFFSLSANLIWFAIIALFFTEFFDQMDGIIARLQGPTLLGAFLDSTLDRIGDFFIVIGIIVGGFVDFILGIIVILGSFLTSYTRVKIESLGKDNLYGIGLLERTDRIPIILIGAIFQLFFLQALFWTMIFLAIGTFLTSLQRIIYAIKVFYKDI